ncbi:hypothetical protein Forpe1208_v000089 [Fusarium oxysporum f. sp. rapae]|uniref:Uncharacterized protein n=1 Tax=Fusarium oxysporum f. sp. rapae TaxID=485398 RepID=A0A8J5PM01_FUSOX|nr:hypothetical protein Forpe1208_v000089 [Fusarium oxysporum f. sp. rapae]
MEGGQHVGSPRSNGPRFSTSDRVVYTVGKHTVILSISKSAEVIDTNFGFDTESCLVYAERVEIRGSLKKQPGKSIGIFCSELQLFPISNETHCTIDVGGDNGSPPSADTPNLANGKAGGTIDIFVEDLEGLQLNKLMLRSTGGNGVSGWDATEKVGGKGGDGGDGGRINVVYCDPIYEFLGRLYDVRSASWSGKLSVVEAFLSTTMPSISTTKLSAQVLESLKKIQSTYGRYRDLIQHIGYGVKSILYPQNAMVSLPNEDLEKVGTEVLETLKSHLDAGETPDLNGTFQFEYLDKLKETITKWLADREDNDDIECTDLIVLLSSLSSKLATLAQTTPLTSTLLALQQNLSDCVQQTNVQISNCGTVTGGSGSPGGRSAQGNDPKFGVHGLQGKSGAVVATPVCLSGSEVVLSAISKLPLAFVHPDQCRMLLKQAEDLYFASGPGDWNTAENLLAKIERRLCFVPGLVTEVQSSSSSTNPSPLLEAYEFMEFSNRLTLHAIGQLNASYNKARTWRARLALGYDMFNHAPNWAPRFSVPFYKKQLSEQLKYLSKLELKTKEYEDQAQEDAAARQSALIGLEATHYCLNQAKAMVTAIAGENGVLQLTGARIAFLTSTVQEKRIVVIKLIADLKQALSEALDWDIEKTFEALSSLCFAPTSFNFAVQSFGLGYKTVSEITDQEGNHVKKEYVIRKMTKSGQTLESLQEAFSANREGEISVDDPSALKITATAEEIKSFIEKFRTKLPKDKSEELLEKLDSYLDLILTRNREVLNYNMALVSLKEARDAVELNTKRGDSYAKQKLELDPNIPAVAFWLRDMRDNLRLEVMRLLNLQSRALQFWALMEPTTFSGSAGPLRDGSDLDVDCSLLVKDFEDGMNNLYRNSYWSVWPNPPAIGGHGSVLYKLSPAELNTFKTKIQGVHTVPVKLTPESLGPPPQNPNVKRSRLFAGKYNIRINQVCVWLLNVQGEQPDGRGLNTMTVDITHMGLETFHSPNDSRREFNHDSVSMQFQFEYDKVKTLSDCTEDRVFSRQDITNNYVRGDVTESSVAAIGPYATWLLRIDTNDNPGINIQGKDLEVFIEFHGASMSRTY